MDEAAEKGESDEARMLQLDGVNETLAALGRVWLFWDRRPLFENEDDRLRDLVELNYAKFSS